MHLSSHCNLRGATALALSAILATTGAQAASGTWTQITTGTASGTWADSVPGNWAGGVVAGGADSTADFSTLDVSGTSTITLGEARTIGNLIFGDTGTTSASSWILAGAGANTLTLSGTAPTITVNSLGSASLTLGVATISTSISGSNGLIKDGNGTVATSSVFGRGVLVLSGSNNYSGGTTISSGALRAQNSSALGTGAVTVNSGAQLQLHGNINLANTININGGSALFSTSSSGTPILSGLVNLQSNAGISLATNSGNAAMILSGTVNLAGNILTVSTVNVTTGPAVTISGVINGSGGITSTGAGRLLISNDNSATYSGTTTLSQGTLELGADGALGTGGFAFNPGSDGAATIRSSSAAARSIATTVTFGGGNANSRYVFGSTSGLFNGNLTFTNTTSVTLSSGQKRFEVGNRTQFDAGFAGAGGITMQTTGSTGLGTLVMNGSSSYTGATTVNAGTLLVNGSLAGGSAVTVATAGTLGGSGTIGGATTVNGVLTPGEDGIAGNLSFASSLNIQGITTGIGALKFDLGTTSDMVTLTGGALTIGSGLLEWDDFTFTALAGFAPGTYTLISTTQAISGSLGSNLSGTISGMDATISFADGGTDIVLTVVPEPSVCLLAGAGLVSVLFLRRRKA